MATRLATLLELIAFSMDVPSMTGHGIASINSQVLTFFMSGSKSCTGATTKQGGHLPAARPLRRGLRRMWSSMGMTKAAVLPDPVSARLTAVAFHPKWNDARWMAEGSLYPSAY